MFGPEFAQKGRFLLVSWGGIGLEGLELSVFVEGLGIRGSGRIWARIAGNVVLADADSFPELARRVECGWELGLCRS